MLLLVGFLAGVAVTAAACLAGDAKPFLSYGRPYPGWVDTLTDHGKTRPRRTRPSLVERAFEAFSPIPDQGEWNRIFEYVLVKEDIALRNVKGRHRREVLELDPAWRARWAEYPTQGWPTLATSGNAADTVDTMRPVICDQGGLLNVDHSGGTGPQREDDAGGETRDLPRREVLPVLRDAYPPGTAALAPA